MIQVYSCVYSGVVTFDAFWYLRECGVVFYEQKKFV